MQTQTPRRRGEPLSAGALDFARAALRPRRTNCWMVGKRFSEWRFDSHAAIADWATSDEYTQIPLLRSSAGGRLPAADGAPPAGGAEPRAAGGPGCFWVQGSRSGDHGPAERGPATAPVGRSPRPGVRLWADRPGARPAGPRRAGLGGRRERAGGRPDQGQRRDRPDAARDRAGARAA